MKIVNWLFGSFFRTIGRTIAILLMGGLLYYILASNGVGISDLFLDNVKASIIDDTYTRQVQIANDNNRSFMLFDDVPTKNIQFPQSFSNTDDSYLFIPIQGQALVDNSVNTQSGDNTIITGWQQYLFVGIQVYKSGNWYTKACQVETNYIYCPLDKNASFTNLYFQTIQGISPEGAYWSIEIQLPYYADVYKTNNQQIVEQQEQTNDAITNQTQQQQQQHQEMMDDNTTQAEDEGSSFFGNFTTEDHGGLNTIITAPLNTIRSLLSSSCTKLTLPLPYVNKNLELPCMNDIYTQHFGLFFSLYQTIILAIISYRCLRSIFFDIAGFTNPDDDRIEVMDL